MLVTKDNVHSGGNDLCCTCSKDITECIFKKALNNYHDGGEIPIRFTLYNCPEYRMIYNRDDEISWGSFDNRVVREISAQFNPYVTLNPNATVRFNTEVTSSGT